ncbi:MAG: uroporphyrinogen decarboxylase family protein [Phycisphaerae bacterium]|nr:uroporphyrinogen decarboxylase family protein [Phycisphaerae bacterium]
MISCERRSRRTANFLRAIHFDRPEWTPCHISFLPAAWMKYRENLEALCLEHPRVFPGFRKGGCDFDAVGDPLYEEGRVTDAWGCVWENRQRGLAGAPVTAPLADWSALESYQPPDPLRDDQFGPRRPWDVVAKDFAEARARGDLAAGGLDHGFMYMRLYYLRGFDNFMLDLAVAEPRLARLIRMVEGRNEAVIRAFLEAGAEILYFGDDLGLQRSLPISPAMWRTYIKPSYARLLGLCTKKNAIVYLHSDGHILEIIPDLVETGVKVLNPQIRANGLEGLRRAARGKVCLEQDLDRQLFPFATPPEIENHVGEVFEGLYQPEGGLMLLAECGPDVPLQNIHAICRAFERLCNLPEA